MNLSYLHRLLLAVDPFSAKRKQPPERHLSEGQLEVISTALHNSATGLVSMTAAPSDKEAVGYQGEIANVLEETGFDVKIDNAKTRPAEEPTPPGVEMTIKDKTVRPVHAYRIVRAFRNAGVAIATRINARRQKNNILYINVGPNAVAARDADDSNGGVIASEVSGGS